MMQRCSGLFVLLPLTLCNAHAWLEQCQALTKLQNISGADIQGNPWQHGYLLPCKWPLIGAQLCCSLGTVRLSHSFPAVHLCTGKATMRVQA